MQTAPKSLRLQLGLFGRTNTGKSSFLNMVVGQDVAITSTTPGTTTDVVEKTMELLPIGPVVFLDTAGIDDNSNLGGLRVARTRKVFERADVIFLITEPNTWTRYEDDVIDEAKKRNTPVIIIVNKIDEVTPEAIFLEKIKTSSRSFVLVSSIDVINRDRYVGALKRAVIDVCPDDFLNPPPLLGDLLPKGGVCVMIIPIDFEAPKGRIILPQVQCIRDALDHGQVSIVVRESEYKAALKSLKKLPDLVVCDSQVVDFMVKNTPKSINCTTFSILFSRYRGDLVEAARAASAIGKLKKKDKILVAEACSHHPIQDDIGRVKMPRWLEEYVGGKLDISTCAGHDYPKNLKDYKLIIHCGACMIARKEMLSRIEMALEAKVPITNYGVAISYIKGVLPRVLKPFPEVLGVYKK
jgi:[FeFe] hydrogenase H-cluster maturation GTPase HydF